jgi:hypothetical protein
MLQSWPTVASRRQMLVASVNGCAVSLGASFALRDIELACGSATSPP